MKTLNKSGLRNWLFSSLLSTDIITAHYFWFFSPFSSPSDRCPRYLMKASYSGSIVCTTILTFLSGLRLLCIFILPNLCRCLVFLAFKISAFYLAFSFMASCKRAFWFSLKSVVQSFSIRLTSSSLSRRRLATLRMYFMILTSISCAIKIRKIMRLIFKIDELTLRRARVDFDSTSP